MSRNDDQSLDWNADVFNALIRWFGLSAHQVERELRENGDESLAKRTAKNLFDHRSKPNSKTLQTVAEYFNAKSDGVFNLTGSDLRTPRPTLRALLARYVEATRHQSASACTVHHSQNDAIEALKRRVSEGLSLNGRTVYVVTFTLDTLVDLVRWLLTPKLEVECVRLYLGLEATASAMNSTRQAQLMRDHQETLTADFGDERIKVLRVAVPPTLNGYFVPGMVVCVSPFVWYPTFRAWGKSHEWVELREKMYKAGVTPPDLKDDYTLNGYQQCHVQLFHEKGGDNSQFDQMAEKFQLYLEAHDLHLQLLNGSASNSA